MGVKRGGGGGLNAKVKGMTAEMRRQLAVAVEAIADKVQSDAQISITNGSVSGKAHVASKPGEPPNNNLGTLANGIIVQPVNDLTRDVVSTAPYAAALELGTSKMAERPYLRPAAKANQQRGVRQMRAAVDSVLNGGKFRTD